MSYHFETLAIHAGQPNEALTGAVVTPIYQTTTFAQDELAGLGVAPPAYCYTRSGNPTREALEANLAALEGGRFGLAFSSGLAAANAVLQALSAGDHVVASQDLYGGCYRLFTKIFARFGVRFSLIDTTRPQNVAKAIEPATKLLWLESPSNPLLKITDLAACSEAAKARRIKVLVDNTFATPVHQRPLALGADIVLHSTTKYIGGHCDVLGGALIVDDEATYESLKFVQNATGGVPGPQDCFLQLRGIKTLALRVRRHAENALAIAEFLEAHSEVETVIYPGLASHPQHELAQRQTSGFGGIMSVEFVGGVERIRALIGQLKLWPLAESLGGVKSLLCHPATMTHASVEPAERRRIGIGDGLVRLSVGLENVEDLIDDLDQALEATRSSRLQEVAS
ncbi:MAG: cystathionine gamma-synthase [Phycisphaerales bacterium]|nr:cystathionine gamma-synthase [Phycisphaerales bacterium]MCI0676804.1 cystathionine gamma-synthase [Phycisphaerales bacterium]